MIKHSTNEVISKALEKYNAELRLKVLEEIQDRFEREYASVARTLSHLSSFRIFERRRYSFLESALSEGLRFVIKIKNGD